MNKGLEALPYFKTLFDIWKEKIPVVDKETKEIEEEYGFKPRYEVIEKELKALEAIKEKKIIPLEQLDYLYLGGKIDKETRDLLKEVLNYGK